MSLPPGQYESHSPEDTQAFGERLARSLDAGDVVLLRGDLGAGKTTLVRGMAGGLGADPDTVSSPTFALIQEYHGRVTLYHVDLYRLERAEIERGALDDLGLDELASQGVVVIEWAERLPRPMPGATVVELSPRDDEPDGRTLSITREADTPPSTGTD